MAIVNRKFARDFFGNRSPIGRRIGLDTGRGEKPDTEIVGLVEDSLYEGPRQGVRRQVFFPFPQMNQSVGAAFYVRTSANTPGHVCHAAPEGFGPGRDHADL